MCPRRRVWAWSAAAFGCSAPEPPAHLDGAPVVAAPATADSCTALHVVPPGDGLPDALDRAAPGACIRLAAGRHVLRRTASARRSGHPDAPIVLEGERGAIIDGARIPAGPTLEIVADHVTVRGLVFEGTPTTGEHNVVVIDGDGGRRGHGVVLRECVVTGGHDQLKIRGMATDVRVEACEFSGTFGHIPISITGARGLTLRDNLFHDWDTGDDGAIQIKGGSRDVLVEANVFRDIDGPGGALALGDGCGASCDHDPEHYAARRLVAARNRFERVQRPLDVLGCRGCALLHNLMIGCGNGTAAIKLGVAETNGVARASVDTLVLGNVWLDAGVPPDELVQIVDDADRGLVWLVNSVDGVAIAPPR